MSKYIKYLPYLLTILCILTVQSTFQKGGAPNPHNYIHLLFPFIIAAFYTLELQEIRWIYKSITYVLISFITLFLCVLVVTPKFIELRYDDSIWYIWEYKETVITNIVYFGGTLAIIYLLMLPLKFFDKSLRDA
jgi:hypothetical protein